MLNGDAHTLFLRLRRELRIRPLPYFQRLEPAQDSTEGLTFMGILVCDYE